MFKRTILPFTGLRACSRERARCPTARPGGRGETELARTLAEFLFGDEDAIIQIDMSVIVIMTSNIGSTSISKNQALGFNLSDEQGLSCEDMKSRVMGDLKKVFRPELLNRIDEIIVFPKLAKDEISRSST